MDTALRRWQEQLAAWAIPEHLTGAVAESPWTLPRAVFARRADEHIAHPGGPSHARARWVLASRGTALDVGAGAGAASLPLADRLTHLTAVDTDPAMLDDLTRRADRLGLATTTVVGRWPDIAPRVDPADLVLCHHVFYNVPDLAAFAAALTRHARRRVVVELTATHPLSALNPLWERLHGLERPTGPTAADAVAVLHEAGFTPRRQYWQRSTASVYRSFDELVEVTRRRICLPAGRSRELASVLVELGVDPHHPADLGAHRRDVVTLWWDV